MALFDDDPSPRPQAPLAPRADRLDRARRRGRRSASRFALLPSPYVIEQPGPVYDTLGTAEHDGEEVPLIEIPDAETFPTDGELNLLTVTVRRPAGADARTGSRCSAPGSTARRSVVPVEAIFPPGVTDADRDAQNAAAMVDSQQDAIAAALVELGYDFPRDVTVAGVTRRLARRRACSRRATSSSRVERHRRELRRRAARRGRRERRGRPRRASLVVRDGAEQTLEVTPVDARRHASVLGVGVRMDYEFPIDVELQLDNVGGPSAGMMFALGIIDKLTPGALTGGEIVAGTGTIDSAGEVGPIGGIRQKLWGAEDAGADWFLAPASNCDEVTGHVPDGLTRVRGGDPRRGAHRRRGDRRRRRHLGASPSCPAA